VIRATSKPRLQIFDRRNTFQLQDNLFISLISNIIFEKVKEVGVAPIPLKLVRAFSEESHSVNTIRQVFFVIAT
jgi:hypothetical protein